jgi:glutathione S-transferase
MIDLYYWTTPNGHKITIFLEEAGVPYNIKPVNISMGEQFRPSFLKISPNNRIPAIVDHDPAGGSAVLSVFESGAILVYLAEKIGKFIPADLAGRVESSSGCSGRWAVSDQWPARTITSFNTRRKKFPTRSSATSRRPTGCTRC